MKKKIKLVWDKNNIVFDLNKSHTSVKLQDSLPVKGTALLWGEEIYFSIPVECDLEEGIEIMDIGDIAYWPTGNAFCIFFGRTPVSTDNKPRAASPVTLLGRISDEKDIAKLKTIRQGQVLELIKEKD